MVYCTSLFKEKGLTAHPDKTGYIVFGSKQYKENIFKELEKCELSLGDFLVKRKNSDRYLGQIFHTDGVKASVEATIVDREGKLNGAIFEVKSILIEDFQMQAVGGMMAAWELWEKAMVPSLLSGAGTAARPVLVGHPGSTGVMSTCCITSRNTYLFIYSNSLHHAHHIRA
jgi:hypothetical protein